MLGVIQLTVDTPVGTTRPNRSLRNDVRVATGGLEHRSKSAHAFIPTMTDKCEYCGDSLADDWVACPKCGKPKYGGVPLVEIVKAPRKTNA